jgi:hypothetical protein
VNMNDGEIEQTAAGMKVPEIIQAAGEHAVAAYREFLNNRKRSPNTLKLYRQHARRFFRWAEGRGLTLESIAAPDISAYFAEVSNNKSSHEASVYLTPVRGVFRNLVSAGVLSENPCGTSRPSPKQVADTGFPKPSTPLSELKLAVLEIGEADGWEEGDEDVQAGLVMMAEFSIGTRDPAAISQFTGVPLPLVEEFAGRLIANHIWLPNGKIAADWDDQENGGLAFMLDVWVATGELERGPPAPSGEVAAPPGDESGSLSTAGWPAGERSDDQ